MTDHTDDGAPDPGDESDEAAPNWFGDDGANERQTAPSVDSGWFDEIEYDEGADLPGGTAPAGSSDAAERDGSEAAGAVAPAPRTGGADASATDERATDGTTPGTSPADRSATESATPAPTRSGAASAGERSDDEPDGGGLVAWVKSLLGL